MPYKKDIIFLNQHKRKELYISWEEMSISPRHSTISQEFCTFYLGQKEIFIILHFSKKKNIPDDSYIDCYTLTFPMISWWPPCDVVCISCNQKPHKSLLYYYFFKFAVAILSPRWILIFEYLINTLLMLIFNYYGGSIF